MLVEDASFKVYMHRNTINQKVYIGITSRSLAHRFGKDGCGYDKCPRFWNAIRKYGWDIFDHILLYDGLTKDQAENLEVELIKVHKSSDEKYGYNIGYGGNGSNNITDEGREKIRESKLGKNNPNYGIKLSKERVEQLKQLKPMLGKHHSEEAKLKMGISKLGKYTGEDHWKSKQVICVETQQVYGSVREASRLTGLYYSGIALCCTGKQKTCNNMHWKYISEEA